MKNMIKVLSAALMLAMWLPAVADQDEYCDGFRDGYRKIKGSTATVPACPKMPSKHENATDYREGYQAGIRAAGGRKMP